MAEANTVAFTKIVPVDELVSVAVTLVEPLDPDTFWLTPMAKASASGSLPW